MAIDPPLQGSIIEYPYLWQSQASSGETEGRKERPVCLAVTLFHPVANEHHLVLLAISSQPPRPDQEAMAIPDTERRRAGLTRYPTAWLVTSEYNYDVAERSFYYDPGAPVLGSFTPTFMRLIATALRETIVNKRGRVDRS